MGNEGSTYVWTVGHSTRALEEFVALLRDHRIARLVDVRRLPRSRRHPHFDGERLAPALAAAGLAYSQLPDLGGLRTPRADSLNGGWRTAPFRGYADHMQTATFAAALTSLTELVAAARVAIMCAEADPRRCHRSLIADALTARRLLVRHIVTPGRADPHALTPFACVEDQRVTYPPTQALLSLKGDRPVGRTDLRPFVD